MSKRLFAILLAVMVSATYSFTAFAGNKILRVSVLDSDTNESVQVTNIQDVETLEVSVDGQKVAETETCGFDLPEERTYKSQLITVRRKLRVDLGNEFRVKVFMKNAGSMPWFSDESKCFGPKMFLGTDRGRDRVSSFYDANLDGWAGNNRVRMDQLRVDPGEIASFTFYGKAPMKDDLIKEYFTPVIKDVQWIDDGMFSFDVIIGDPKDDPATLRKKMLYAYESGSVQSIDLNAEKTLLVDLSDQTVNLMLGDHTIRQFPVSTGAYKTPTPVGETRITLKQEVRVAGKYPHYIMPKFLWFRAGGYGFHALPSLGSDGGVFWTEARNHIGIPVSHGCIRLLPEDADFMFDFTEIGTRVVVQR